MASASHISTRLLSQAKAAQYCGCCSATFKRDWKPALTPIVQGKGQPAYDRQEIDAIIDAKRGIGPLNLDMSDPYERALA